MAYSLKIEKDWVNNLLQDLPDMCARGDNINVWGIPTVGMSTYVRDLGKQNTDNDINFVYIDIQQLLDLNSESFYSLLSSELSFLVTDEAVNKRIDKLPESAKLITQIKEIVTNDKKLCIVIDRLDPLRALEDQTLVFLKSLRDKFMGSVCFIFVSTKPLDEDEHYKNFPYFIDFACHNQIVSGPFVKEKEEEIKEKCQKYCKTKLSQSYLDELLNLSGGLFGLLKSMLRAVDSDKDYKVTSSYMLEYSPLVTRLDLLFKSFSKQEQIYLIDKALGNKPNKDFKTKYIEESGILENDKIKSMLFSNYLKTKDKPELSEEPSKTSQPKKRRKTGLHIDSKSGEIYLDGERQDDILSETELKVINFMIDQGDKITSREQIAEAMWGEDYLEEYSDWAIDKMISRVRKKLGENGHPYKYLITLKGKGFKLHLTK